MDCQIELCHDRTKQVRFAIRKFNSNANDLSKIIVQTEKAVNGIGMYSLSRHLTVTAGWAGFE